MLNHSKNIDVSGFLTVIHGNLTSITYESQHVGYPTNSCAGSKALKTLHENIAASAMHNSKERYDAPKCHPETRKAVLNDITSWVSDHSKKSSILWLSAPAGSGKSAILQQISENFHKSGRLAASFFFSRSLAERNTDHYLIATLASQLATSIPATRPFIEGAIERDPSIFKRLLSEQINHLVVYPLVYASLHPENGSPWPTLLVIDGLDECNGGEHQVDILRILRTALLQLKRSLPRLYLLIASRPESAITAVFDDELWDITRHLVLDDTYHPDHDITVYLRSSFADIYRRRHARFPSMASLPQPWPPEHITSFLVGKSSGQFIFAATVIRFIDVDRKIPTAQLQTILDICESVDSSRFAANPFALLDDLYIHVLKSSEETERAISILGAIFYLDTHYSPILKLLQELLQLEPEDVIMIFWDLHSVVHIPTSDGDPIRFYHASLRDFLMDRHRSGSLYVDGSKAHSFLLRSCIQTLSRSIPEETLALQYSGSRCLTHYVYGDQLNPGFLDKILEEFQPETWLPLDISADVDIFISWWNRFAPSRGCLHGRCDPERCSALCFRYTSILDRYLVYRFRKHKNPTVSVSLMWLTVLGSGGQLTKYLWVYSFALRDAEWLWDIPTKIQNRFQFLCFLMHFLSDRGRSHHLYVGSAISTTHFAHVCAQRVWRGILTSESLFDSENWRMLNHLHIILNLLILGDLPQDSPELMDKTIIQCIQRRLDNLADLAKFVEATGAEGGEVSFESQVSRWKRTSMGGTTHIDFATAVSGKRSFQSDVGTSPSWGKCEGQTALSSDNGMKRRKIDIYDLLNPDDKTVTKNVPVRRHGEGRLM